MKNRIFAMLAALLLLCTLPVAAFAHDTVDMDRIGSVRLDVSYDGEPVVGGVFSCVKVADVVEEDGDYFFRQVFDGTEYREELSSDLAQELYRLVEENPDDTSANAVSLTNESGTVVFKGLLPGLYLIMQEEAAPGYSLMKPFLVSVPYMTDGVYQYDVSAVIKSELEQELPSEPTTPDEPTAPPDVGLPQTGQLNWPVPLMAIAGMFLFAAGWVIHSGHKKDTRDRKET